MKILFFGDSITDAGRDKEDLNSENRFGNGFVKCAVNELVSQGSTHEFINRGISGNRIVDLYARIKCDCWNLKPDVLSILIGVNDIWHEIETQNGVELDRFEKVYRMLLEDTVKRLPNVKIILCEPFVLKGVATVNEGDKWQRFLAVYEYASVVKKLAEEYGLYFLPLQEKLSKVAGDTPSEYLTDGVHPAPQGAKLIADEWIKCFKEQVE